MEQFLLDKVTLEQIGIAAIFIMLCFRWLYPVLIKKNGAIESRLGRLETKFELMDVKINHVLITLQIKDQLSKQTRT